MLDPMYDLSSLPDVYEASCEGDGPAPAPRDVELSAEEFGLMHAVMCAVHEAVHHGSPWDGVTNRYAAYTGYCECSADAPFGKNALQRATLSGEGRTRLVRMLGTVAELQQIARRKSDNDSRLHAHLTGTAGAGTADSGSLLAAKTRLDATLHRALTRLHERGERVRALLLDK